MVVVCYHKHEFYEDNQKCNSSGLLAARGDSFSHVLVAGIAAAGCNARNQYMTLLLRTAGGSEESGRQALHLEVERTNAVGQTLYRKFGFEDHDRYLMSRRIAP